MTKIIKISDAPRFDKNPFLMDDKPLIREQGNKQTLIGSVDTALVDRNGEVQANSVLMRRETVDKDQFAKLYIDQLGLLFNLNNAGIRVLTHILSNLKPNNDSLIMITKEVAKALGISTTTVFSGLAQLLDAEIIAKSRIPNFYFVNPRLIFNGNRMTFVRQYEKREAKQKRLFDEDNKESKEPVKSGDNGVIN